VIARLTEQKGLDLLRAALPALLDRGGQLAVLGAGDAGLEAAWREAGDQYRRVGVRIGYDESLSHRMVAGADAILVPSRFEPCGLTQLMGLRYGAIPLVTRVGGLADTVIHANAAACMAGVATGLQVHPPTPEALGRGLADLCALYEDAALWLQMQRNAMRHPVGWQSSADAYAALYAGISRAA
jgi:starch synthase